MITAKNKRKVIITAKIKRKDGTIEDVGVLTEIKSPFLFQKIKKLFRGKGSVK